MKEKRRLYTGIIAVIVFLAIVAVFAAVWKVQKKDSDLKPQLSLSELQEKTGEECIEILKAHGLVLPEVYEQNKESAEEAVKTIINGLDEDMPAAGAVPYSYTEMADLAGQVMDIIDANTK